MKDSIMWVVSAGSSKTYFYDEGDARSYAGDRFSFDEDGIPFISKVTLSEAISVDKSASGNQYRAENAARPEVTTLASGLQYEVIKTGGGAKPGPTDTVSTHYHGMLIDGTVFDSSVDRGIPAEFPVNGLIAGWTEALQLMAVGSKWRLVIPPELAYGERGSGGVIPPQATLVFEVELLAIVD